MTFVIIDQDVTCEIPVFSLLTGDPKVISEDEEYKKVNFEKFTSLKSVFQKDGN